MIERKYKYMALNVCASSFSYSESRASQPLSNYYHCRKLVNMVVQEDFLVEKFMDKHEKFVKFNLGESCCYSLSPNDLLDLIHEKDGDKISRKVRNELEHKFFEQRLTYGDIFGSLELKRAIVLLYDDKGISEENVIITNGAIGANFLTFYTLVNPDDHCIVVDPSYQQLSSVPKVFSGNSFNVDNFSLEFGDGFLPDLGKLERLIRPGRTKLIVINNPNNPTGVVWPNEILSRVVALCQEHGIYLLCDEVYRPLFHTASTSPDSIIKFGYDKTISTSSMSKAFSLAGLRLGWIVSKDKIFLDSAKSKRDYNMISISMLDDLLARVALRYASLILERNYELCKKNLAMLEAFVNESKGLIKWIKPTGGSTAFIKLNCPNISTMSLCEELALKGCLLVPGEVFNGRSGFVRVGFGNSEEDIKGGLKILKEYLKEKGLWR